MTTIQIDISLSACSMWLSVSSTQSSTLFFSISLGKLSLSRLSCTNKSLKFNQDIVFCRAIWILAIAALTAYYLVALKNIWDQMASPPPQPAGKFDYLIVKQCKIKCGHLRGKINGPLLLCAVSTFAPVSLLSRGLLLVSSKIQFWGRESLLISSSLLQEASSKFERKNKLVIWGNQLHFPVW